LVTMAEAKSFIFFFPILPGHINPTFPVAKALMAKGHKVTYVCRDIMRPAIEGIGATLVLDSEICPTMMDGNELDAIGFGVADSLKAKFGVDKLGWMKAWGGVEFSQLVMQLEDLPKWLKEQNPSAVFYCPMICPCGGFAAKLAGIPAFSLTTTAGPGSLKPAYGALLAMDGQTPEELFQWRTTAAEHRIKALVDLKEKYGWDAADISPEEPPLLGFLPCTLFDKMALTTTIGALMEPMTPELAAFYEKHGVKWEGVGPLLDDEGAGRALAMRRMATDELHAANPDKVLEAVRMAKKAGRLVLVVSMGTLVTGDDPRLGWEARTSDAQGNPTGILNKDYCRAAWGGVFDAAGKSRDHVGPLIVVAIGSQKDALGDLEVPANAICQQSIPQVDVLSQGVDCFVMGGGQNGFQEGLVNSTPFVVCPGIADQVVTGAKATAMGVGLCVNRPDCEESAAETAKAEFRAAIAQAVETVLAEGKFKEAVSEVSKQFASAGGIARVVGLLETA